MDIKKVIGWGIIGVGAWWVATKVRLGTSLNFIFSGITTGGDILNPTITLKFIVENPTDYETTVSDIHGALYINSTTQIADVVNVPTLHIPPNSNTEIEIPMHVIFSGIANTITQLFNSSGSKFTFKGDMTVEGVPYVPLIITYNV